MRSHCCASRDRPGGQVASTYAHFPRLDQRRSRPRHPGGARRFPNLHSTPGDDRLRRRALDREDAARSAPTPSVTRRDDRLPRQPSASRRTAGYASAVRASHLPRYSIRDAHPFRGRRRPPHRVERCSRPNDDHGVAFVTLLCIPCNFITPPSDVASAQTSSAVRESAGYGRRVLRLLPRPDRRRAEWHRASPRARVPLSQISQTLGVSALGVCARCLLR
jgi:hypothetical protein